MNIPFEPGQLVIDKSNPSQLVTYTGKSRPLGSVVMVELKLPNGNTRFRPLTEIESIDQTQLGTIAEQLSKERFGTTHDLKRLITYEKLKGTLHEVIYSMEAAEIDFFPYQFKPVIKFINSPTERLVLADEVGLGKTIEAGLIWLEMQARYQSNRLLVVCPKILAEKWREELRIKFLINAKIVNHEELKREIIELQKNGPDYPFALISTYSGLRPSKQDKSVLKVPLDETVDCDNKAQFLRELRFWNEAYAPFDMLIFDEAHYMRNQSTTTYHLGECLSANARAVLCISATPVNNTNIDLHSLLKIVDEDFFETQSSFQDLIDVNKPAVQAANAISRTPVDVSSLQSAIFGMQHSDYIKNSPLFNQFLEVYNDFSASNHQTKGLQSRCQDILEKLNLLGSYINRTRRVQVKENRPVRNVVIALTKYKQEEMVLYKSICSLVKKKCQEKKTAWHVFQILSWQLMAASCLPAFASKVLSEGLPSDSNIIAEAFGEEMQFESSEDDLSITNNLKSILEYDFELNDSKFDELKKILASTRKEKIIIFAYYRPTLAYLKRRLLLLGEDVALIHGGVDTEERWNEIDRFKSPQGPRILLASEVGSEGIDLQFCSTLINYDLPWNPMRVEQRIGRIDRVGQKANKLTIINFKVEGTIEERIYQSLHEKLERFSSSLGDLDEVVGKEVRQLTIDLLSKELTPEQQDRRIMQTQLAIENKLTMIKDLEESGDALIAFSDYVQIKVEEDREKGRYIQPSEIEDYVSDFFNRNFRGTEINYNTPVLGCLRIRLSSEAFESLVSFTAGDQSLSARHLRKQELSITFNRQVSQVLPASHRKKTHFINHLSPFIRWITKINKDKEHEFYKLSAVKIKHPTLQPGTYLYNIERWAMDGVNRVAKLSYGLISLDTDLKIPTHESEQIIQDMLQKGSDWSHREYDRSVVVKKYDELQDYMYEHFNNTVKQFEIENTNTLKIKEARINSVFNRRIEQDERRLATSTLKGSEERVLRMARGRLSKAHENKAAKISKLLDGANVIPDMRPVAVGLLYVEQ